VEKGHEEVLGVLGEYGVDVGEAVEICDNAGRTPLFEATDYLETPHILRVLVKGMGAKVNVVNYNG